MYVGLKMLRNFVTVTPKTPVLEAQKLLEVSDRRAKYVLEKMEKARLLRQEGRQKGARYLFF